ncbi:MAG TPA: hypothetical protein VHM26_12460 [Chitinophagaceae bacterium]|jgi:hypothetical protein|nr:hypothetical protein [Chitinophagaceae bacterium]
MKRFYFILLIACITLSFSTVWAQEHEKFLPNSSLLPRKIVFPTFTLIYKWDGTFNANLASTEAMAGLEIEGKKQQSIFYTISCREKVSLKEISAQSKKIASMISAYIRSADSSVVNINYVDFSIGTDKHDDSVVVPNEHFSLILTTTDHSLRQKYYNYSLLDADTALTHLYDIDYIQKVTGANMAKRKKIYADMSAEVQACAIKKADSAIDATRIKIVAITEKPEAEERRIEPDKGELIYKNSRSCFEAAIRSKLRIPQNKSVMEYLYSEWCIYRKTIGY